MLSRLFFIASFLLLFCQCSNNNSTASETDSAADNAATTNTLSPTNNATANVADNAAAANTVSYPSIPVERLEYLWNNASYMDVVFYELPVSMNQSTLESIRTTLAHIAEEVPAIPANCKSIGRIFFQVGQENVESAEIYFQPGCTFYLWLEDDKPAYANQMTEAGVNFYNNIFKSVRGEAATQ